MAQPFKISAIAVLSDEDGFLTAAEIVERAVQKGLLDRDKTTQAPEGMMSAVLSNNIRQRGSDSEFVKLDGRFGLNRAGGRAASDAADRPLSDGLYEAAAELGAGAASDAADRPLSGPAAAGQNRKGTGATSEAPNQILFNGRAGEYSVISELLFYGFDACMTNVDAETDVFAVKDGKCFFLQVKTSVPAGSRCSFFISPGAHKKFDRPGAYYAFVARSGTGNDFLVMPHSEVQKHVESGGIGKSGSKYIAKFVWRDKITLDGADVTCYRRRWPEA